MLPQLANSELVYNCNIIQGELPPDDFYSFAVTLTGTSCDTWDCAVTTDWNGREFKSKGYEYCGAGGVDITDINNPIGVIRMLHVPYDSTLENTAEQSSSTTDTTIKSNLAVPVSLYNQVDTKGELWIRNINHTIIDTFSNVFSDIIDKYREDKPQVTSIDITLIGTIQDPSTEVINITITSSLGISATVSATRTSTSTITTILSDLQTLISNHSTLSDIVSVSISGEDLLLTDIQSNTPGFDVLVEWVTGNSTTVQSTSARHSAYNAIGTELKNNNIKDFEIVHDILIIETENYIVVERINYDYTTNKILPSTNENIYFSIPTNVLSKVIKPFYNEDDNLIIFGWTDQVSCSNYIFVPVLYSIEIDTLRLKKLTSWKSENVIHNFAIPESVRFMGLSGYSDINRPIISYNKHIQKYTLTTFGTLSGSNYSNDNKCVIKSDYLHIPNSSTFKLIDNSLYCVPNNKFLESSYSYSQKPVATTVLLDTFTPNYNINTNTHIFDVVFDCDLIKQKGDPVTLQEERDDKILKIEYDFGDGSKKLVIDRKLSYNISDSGDIAPISELDDDYGDPRLQRIKHTYYTSGDESTIITATVKVIYPEKTDLKIITITSGKFTSKDSFNDVNLLDVCTFTDQYNKETSLLTFELGDDTSNNPRYTSTIALY